PTVEYFHSWCPPLIILGTFCCLVRDNTPAIANRIIPITDTIVPKCADRRSSEYPVLLERSAWPLDLWSALKITYTPRYNRGRGASYGYNPSSDRYLGCPRVGFRRRAGQGIHQRRRDCRFGAARADRPRRGCRGFCHSLLHHP